MQNTNGKPVKPVTYTVEDFHVESTSSLAKDENGIMVNYRFEGMTEAQFTWLLHDSATRLYALKFARAGRDAKAGTTEYARWEIAKRESKCSFTMKEYVPTGVRVASKPKTNEERLLDLIASGLSKEDAVKELVADIMRSAEKMQSDDVEHASTSADA